MDGYNSSLARTSEKVGAQFAGRVGLFLRVDDFDAAYERMTAAGHPRRIYGEMVALPWEGRDVASAVALEDLEEHALLALGAAEQRREGAGRCRGGRLGGGMRQAGVIAAGLAVLAVIREVPFHWGRREDVHGPIVCPYTGRRQEATSATR